MGPPGGGRNNITGRFTRHFNIISIDSFDDSTLTRIFSSIVDWHFSKGFDAIFNRLGKVSTHSFTCLLFLLHFFTPYSLSLSSLLSLSIFLFISFSQIMVQATMSVYKSAVVTFLPTPTKSHYVFNLRDFSRVVRGVLLIPKTHMSEGDKLIRLWVHEVYRIFYDRLIDDNDRLATCTVHV